MHQGFQKHEDKLTIIGRRGTAAPHPRALPRLSSRPTLSLLVRETRDAICCPLTCSLCVCDSADGACASGSCPALEPETTVLSASVVSADHAVKRAHGNTIN
ncbi:unnamed protein product [Pieris brassicae]|uniref:Uncharacterized protein n=1 Tax=Pieris brassicae TaxID=7116 RepID=A0A9P0XBD1_PIEBR|nr:unnamed protein product [Pieris brassicae]